MIEKLREIIRIERTDDILLLWEQLKAMGVIRLVDKHFPQHANWEGELSAGEVIAVWLCFVLSCGNHRVSHVEGWAAQHLHLLEALTGKAVRALDFSDDRLASLLTQLGDDERWPAFERELSGQLLRVYDLSAQRVRVDATTGKTYAEVSEGGLFQFGPSKDHRPDLAPVKLSMATLDPLGLPLSTTVVAGNTADDPLSAPEISCVRATTGQRGLTYVGDKKMAALQTRAFIASGGDDSVCPLPLKQLSERERERLIAEFFARQHEPQLVIQPETEAAIGIGFEIALERQTQLAGQPIQWTERVLAFSSFERAQSEAKKLDEAIAGAQSELLQLNEGKQGKKRLTAEQPAEAGAQIVKRHGVEGLVNWQIQTTLKERPVRAWKASPARTQCEQQHEVRVELDPEARLRKQEQLGWSF